MIPGVIEDKINLELICKMTVIRHAGALVLEDDI